MDKRNYLDVRDFIKNDIISGRVLPAEKLPPIKDMAEKYEVNGNTVHRALLELEREGLIYSKRTTGKYVTENLMLIKSTRNTEARKVTERFIAKIDELGIGPEELVNIFIGSAQE